MAGIACASFEDAVDVQGFVDKDGGIAVPGLINIAVAAAAGADRCSRREAGRQAGNGMAGGYRRREAVAGTTPGNGESRRQI